MVLNLIEEDNFIVLWRVMKEDEKGFTWSRKNPRKKQARLAYFLITENCFGHVINSSIIPGYRTDHSAILLKLKFQKMKERKVIGNSITV